MAKAILLAMIVLALPSLAADPVPATTFFDIPPGGILAGLVMALVSALGTHQVMRRRQSAERQDVRITPQPIKVESVPAHITDPLCDAKHRAIDQRLSDNRDDHGNIFPRLSCLETRISVLEGTISEIRSEYKSIDAKLTVLLRRK